MRLGDGVALAAERERTILLLRHLLRQFNDRGGFLTGDLAALEAWAEIQDAVRALGRLAPPN